MERTKMVTETKIITRLYSQHNYEVGWCHPIETQHEIRWCQKLTQVYEINCDWEYGHKCEPCGMNYEIIWTHHPISCHKVPIYDQILNTAAITPKYNTAALVRIIWKYHNTNVTSASEHRRWYPDGVLQISWLARILSFWLPPYSTWDRAPKSWRSRSSSASSHKGHVLHVPMDHLDKKVQALAFGKPCKDLNSKREFQLPYELKVHPSHLLDYLHSRVYTAQGQRCNRHSMSKNPV